MKRIICVATALIMLFSCLMISSNADGLEPVGVVKIGYGTPTIDGVINGAGEGWLCGFTLNNTLYGTAWSSHADYRWVCRYYTAYDSNGIYFAADMDDDFYLNLDGSDGVQVHNETILSVEDTSMSDTNGFAFDGDIFILALDPTDYFMREGYEAQSDFTAWYNVGLFADGAKIFRTWSPRAENYGETGEISSANVVGSKTATGWMFEAYIPWSEIAKDCTAASGGEWNPTVAELSAPSEGSIYTNGVIDRANGNTWTAGDIMYVDRYIDEDTGGVGTWQRYLTTAASVRGGFGTQSDGISLACYGIYFKLLSENSTEIPGRYGGGGDMESGSGSGTINETPVENTSGAASGDSAVSEQTSTGATNSSGKSTAASGSAQTGEEIPIAIAVFAISAVAVIALKKRIVF